MADTSEDRLVAIRRWDCGERHCGHHNAIRDLLAMIEARDVELSELRAKLVDDPEWDCTDAAHPAWWRGQEHAVVSVCQLLNQIMDGAAYPSGSSAEPWDSTRRRLSELVRSNAELRDVVTSLQQEGSGRRYD